MDLQDLTQTEISPSLQREGIVEDQILSFRKNLQLNTKDEDLVAAIDKAISEASSVKYNMEKRANRNKLIWEKGTQDHLESLHKKKGKTVVNRIFTDIETCLPILTANTPDATVLVEDNNTRESLQKGLQVVYETQQKMQQKLQILLRQWFINFIGVLKYRWDEDKGFVTENVIPKKIGFDKRATTFENCEFIWEEMEDSLQHIIDKYPSSKKKIEEKYGKDNLKNKVKYIEFWGGYGEWVAWKLENIILYKIKNPNFDYEVEENNIFKKPKAPYLLFNVFKQSCDNSVYDDTSLIEQCIPIQETINKINQQIIDLNEGMKRVWIMSGDAISKDNAQSVVNETGDLLVYLDRGTPAGGIQSPISGRPDNAMFTHLSMLLNEIDNIIGIHSTTRGDRQEPETLGGRQLLTASDYGRLDMIVRNIEQLVEEWYMAYLHMVKVYQGFQPVVLADETHTYTIDPQMIPSDVQVMVKRGTTLPTDDKSRMDMAMALAQAGMIDPKTLFEELGYANPDQRVQDLYQWLQATGKMVPQQLQQSTQQIQPEQPRQTGQTEQSEQQAEQTPESLLARLSQILSNPNIKNLPIEEQQAVVQKGRQILESLKQG